jgi:hypothetical protein
MLNFIFEYFQIQTDKFCRWIIEYYQNILFERADIVKNAYRQTSNINSHRGHGVKTFDMFNGFHFE